jgi:hypothetical protein
VSLLPLVVKAVAVAVTFFVPLCPLW